MLPIHADLIKSTRVGTNRQKLNASLREAPPRPGTQRLAKRSIGAIGNDCRLTRLMPPDHGQGEDQFILDQGGHIERSRTVDPIDIIIIRSVSLSLGGSQFKPRIGIDFHAKLTETTLTDCPYARRRTEVDPPGTVRRSTAAKIEAALHDLPTQVSHSPHLASHDIAMPSILTARKFKRIDLHGGQQETL